MGSRWETGRTEAFSDGVFAIAITLLALDIRIPDDVDVHTEHGAWHALAEVAPSILAFLLSFVIIGMFWASHLRKYRNLASYDRTFIRLDLLLLAAVAFVPFPTAFVSETPETAATVVYAGTMALVALLSALLWWYAAYRRTLLEPAPDTRERQAELALSLGVAGVFAVSIIVALVSSSLARLCWLLILAVVRWGPGSRWRPGRADDAA